MSCINSSRRGRSDCPIAMASAAKPIVPKNQPIGMHKLSCGAKHQAVFVGFNAQDEAGGCHYTDADGLEELVMGEEGAVFKSRTLVPWEFNQFSPPMLVAIDKLMRDDHVDAVVRASPARFARFLTSAINKRVLHGRWDGNYDDGTPPGEWTSSCST